ncbi:MAG: hypothetical protein J0I65_02905 [Variovorax sp.]|nr:hypothetical protein [Variovorax sp.]
MLSPQRCLFYTENSHAQRFTHAPASPPARPSPAHRLPSTGAGSLSVAAGHAGHRERLGRHPRHRRPHRRARRRGPRAAGGQNVPGAGSTLGTDIAAKAQPDGHTLCVVATSHAINPSVYAKLPDDTARDLAPDHAHCQPDQPAGGAPRCRREDAARADRPRQARTRQADLRLGRQRPVEPPVRRDAAQHGGHRHRPRSLQGQRGGDDRRARRPHLDDVRRPAVGHAAGQGRQAARDRGDRIAALGRGTGVPDIERVGRGRFQRQLLARPRRPRRHAQAGALQAGRSRHARPARRRRAPEAARAGGRAGRWERPSSSPAPSRRRRAGFQRSQTLQASSTSSARKRHCRLRRSSGQPLRESTVICREQPNEHVFGTDDCETRCAVACNFPHPTEHGGNPVSPRNLLLGGLAASAAVAAHAQSSVTL